MVDLLPTGKSCRQIAREVGVSPNSVSRIAKDQGHAWGHINAERAHEARRSYGAEWRADFAARLAVDLEHLRNDLRKPTEQWSFGGRDNLFSHETTDEPSPQQKRDLMAAITTGVKAILEIDRHDRQTDADSAVDQFLQRLKAGAE